MNTTDLQQLNINVLTQEQYEQAKADETLDADALYMIPDNVAENPYVEKKTPMFELDTSAQSGVDKELYDALVSLGWEDVIE